MILRNKKYVNYHGPMSRNDLDPEYLHTLIYSINCLHLITFRSQAAIVSEKSVVFTFSQRKLQICPCRRIGQGQPKVILSTNYDQLKSPVLHTKFHGNRSAGSGEEDL